MTVGSRLKLNNIINDSEIKLEECDINRLKETKTLGIIIDKNLWKIDGDSIITKVSKCIQKIRNIHQDVCLYNQKHKSQMTMQSFCHTFIRLEAIPKNSTFDGYSE